MRKWYVLMVCLLLITGCLAAREEIISVRVVGVAPHARGGAIVGIEEPQEDGSVVTIGICLDLKGGPVPLPNSTLRLKRRLFQTKMGHRWVYDLPN